MFTIKRTNEKNASYKTTKNTIEEAQQDARLWMNYWKSTIVYLTSCPKLTLFESGQWIIYKETL